MCLLNTLRDHQDSISVFLNMLNLPTIDVDEKSKYSDLSDDDEEL